MNTVSLKKANILYKNLINLVHIPLRQVMFYIYMHTYNGRKLQIWYLIAIFISNQMNLTKLVYGDLKSDCIKIKFRFSLCLVLHETSEYFSPRIFPVWRYHVFFYLSGTTSSSHFLLSKLMLNILSSPIFSTFYDKFTF